LWDRLLEKLTDDYRKFVAPGRVGRAVSALTKQIGSVAPDRLQRLAADAIGIAAESDFIKAALTHAGRGFQEIVKHASRFAQSPKRVIEVLRFNGVLVERFEHVCRQRSYEIERVCTGLNHRDILAAVAEGAATGAPGLIGVPFNIALSFFLYFRAAQSTALYYGYDVLGDPRELEFASEVTLASLAPNAEKGAETLGGLIGKMMVAANVSALRHALARRTYEEMARRGGAELLYVQIRAMANKAAARALRGAGTEGLESSVFRTLLERVGSRLPKEAGKKAVPLLGAVIGGLSDGWYMSRVLRGSNLIYHKRFLFEKEHRVRLLDGGDNA
jgi:EcsC protein family